MLRIALKSPIVTTSLIVALSLLYVFFIYKDLQSHNKHIYELQQRVDMLYKIVLTRPPTTTEAATQPEDEDDEEEEEDEVVSVASDELRSMLDIISEPPEREAAAAPEGGASLAELRAFLKSHNASARGSRDVLLARAAEIKSKLESESNNVANAEAV